MTLKEPFDFDSRLKDGMIFSEQGTPGVDAPLAGKPDPFVTAAEFTDESFAGGCRARASARFLESAAGQASSSALAFIAPQADLGENRMYPTDVH